MNGQSVDNLIEAGIPFPPYQLTGIERDDRKCKDEDAAVCSLKHLVGDRVGMAGERIVDLIGDQNRKQTSGQEQHEKKDVLDGLGEVQPGQGKELPP